MHGHEESPVTRAPAVHCAAVRTSCTSCALFTTQAPALKRHSGPASAQAASELASAHLDLDWHWFFKDDGFACGDIAAATTAASGGHLLTQ